MYVVAVLCVAPCYAIYMRFCSPKKMMLLLLLLHVLLLIYECVMQVHVTNCVLYYTIVSQMLSTPLH
jgi:hypothetical protein